MLTEREDETSYIIDFLEEETWDDFDVILNKLSQEFNLRIVACVDGPESRICDIEIDGIPLSLHNNPYGNYLKAVSPMSRVHLKHLLGKLRIVFY